AVAKRRDIVGAKVPDPEGIALNMNVGNRIRTQPIFRCVVLPGAALVGIYPTTIIIGQPDISGFIHGHVLNRPVWKVLSCREMSPARSIKTGDTGGGRRVRNECKPEIAVAVYHAVCRPVARQSVARGETPPPVAVVVRQAEPPVGIFEP